jgi:hypothetical protein
VGATEDWVPIFDHVAAERIPAFLEILTAPVVLPP